MLPFNSIQKFVDVSSCVISLLMQLKTLRNYYNY